MFTKDSWEFECIYTTFLRSGKYSCYEAYELAEAAYMVEKGRRKYRKWANFRATASKRRKKTKKKTYK